MRRRGFLALLGAGTSAGLAGCTGGGGQIDDTDGDGMVDSKDYAPWDPEVQQKSQLVDESGSGSSGGGSGGDGSGGGGASTPEPTPEPTPQSTPEPTPDPAEFEPVIEAANLVSELRSLEDVEDNALDSAEAGSVILIGFRFRVMAHDGSVEATEEVEIVGPGGETVAEKSVENTQSVNGTGERILVHGLQFNTAEWETGDYTANVVIRDEISGQESSTATAEFELT